MYELALTFLASFAFIATKAFQQRNVAYDHYVAILPTSFAMALTEVYVVANIVTHGYSLPLVAAIGLGSGTGCMVAMAFHKWLFRRGS